MASTFKNFITNNIGTSNTDVYSAPSRVISSTVIGLTMSAIWLKTVHSGNPWTKKMIWLLLIQTVTGVMTIFTGAPIAMQVLHLLLADLVWISFVLMWAEFRWGGAPDQENS